MPVSTPTMSRLLGRLTAAMGKPFSDARVEKQAAEYAKAMGGLPEYAVEWAVDRAIRECERYPKAAELRKLAHQCPQLANGNHDQSLRAQMQRWEADPWDGIESLDGDRTACRSNPCPVCGSVLVFSDRGYVITHDGRLHREANAPFSNVGRQEWFELGPPIMPEKPKRPSVIPLAWATLNEPKPGQHSEPAPPTAAVGQLPPDEGWDLEQQERASAESAA